MSRHKNRDRGKAPDPIPAPAKAEPPPVAETAPPAESSRRRFTLACPECGGVMGVYDTRREPDRGYPDFARRFIVTRYFRCLQCKEGTGKRVTREEWPSANG